MERNLPALLSEFMSRRADADPALAQDLLEATGWDLDAALAAFDGLNVTYEQKDRFEESISGISLSEYDEIDLERDLSPPNSANSEQNVKRRRKKGAKGLANAAEEISDTFLRVAVSETKLKVGEDKKEQVFNEQFFKHSFLRPDFSKEAEELQTFIASDITETSHKHVLEKSGRLNWWASTGKLPTLEPLATSGDGNCLLHAASLYMWGLPDQNLILRTHLHRVLTDSRERDGLYRRWKHSTHLHNQEAGGLTFSDEEWEFEWHEIIRIATNQPRRRPTTNSLRRYSTLRPHYESLEEIHVFALAHVLHRPIIVVADEFLRNMEGEPLAPIYFGGVYLPLECSPSLCFKSPLILAYDSSHFSPLVAKKDPAVAERQKNSRFRHLQSKHDTVIPLVSPDGSLLPVIFAYDPKKRDFPEKWAQSRCPPGEFPDEILSLLESYLELRWVQLDIGGSKFGSANEMKEEGRLTIPIKIPKVRFPAAVVSSLGEPEYQSLLVEKYLQDVRKRFEEDKERREKVAAERARQEEEMKKIQAARPVPCKGQNCDLYGTAATDYLCSRCYTRAKPTSSGAPPTSGHRNEPPQVPSPPAARRKQPHLPIVQTNTPPELITRQTPTTPVGEEWDFVEPDIELMSNIEGTQAPPTTHHSNSSTANQSTKAISSSKRPDPPILAAAPQPKISKPHPHNPYSRSDKKAAHSSPTRGYSRDAIKPINFDGNDDKVKCQTPKCQFFGTSETDGYCSQCYRKIHPSITQV